MVCELLCLLVLGQSSDKKGPVKVLNLLFLGPIQLDPMGSSFFSLGALESGERHQYSTRESFSCCISEEEQR
jgi:hypothetical protein